MNFLFYVLILLLAVVANSFITIILITLRVGLSFCNDICKSNEYEKEEIISAIKLKKKYYIGILIDILLVISITCIVILFLNKYILAYLFILAIFVLLSIGKTGKNNQNNVLEFYNSLKANYPNEDTDNNKENKTYTPEQIIKELVKQSGLSKDVCTDIYQILITFMQNKDLAYKKIETSLIPDLIAENNIGNVGIAFGMLINENGLTKEESIKYSETVMQEIVRINNIEK